MFRAGACETVFSGHVDAVHACIAFFVQMREVVGDLDASYVVPGAGADSIARVHRRRTAQAEVGVPGARSRAHGGREHLAFRVRSREPSEVSAERAASGAGDEEAKETRGAGIARTAGRAADSTLSTAAGSAAGASAASRPRRSAGAACPRAARCRAARCRAASSRAGLTTSTRATRSASDPGAGRSRSPAAGRSLRAGVSAARRRAGRGGGSGAEAIVQALAASDPQEDETNQDCLAMSHGASL